MYATKKKVKQGEKVQAPIRLDLGCGDNKKADFFGVDKFKTPSADLVHDLLKYPWPWKDGTVEEIHTSHFFEHIPGPERPKFMDEVYRVLKPGGKIQIIVPYFKSPRAIQDFSHAWPPIAEESFLYFNRAWREANKLTHGFYEMKCDFDFVFAHGVDNEWMLRSEETRSFASKHYFGVIADLYVTLTKREQK